jgi:hypothetical protein
MGVGWVLESSSGTPDGPAVGVGEHCDG